MRYVLFVTLPAHMQYVDNLVELHTIIEDMSEEDERYQFEILPCKK
jgi:pyruvate-formate lyase-activating enzyme